MGISSFGILGDWLQLEALRYTYLFTIFHKTLKIFLFNATQHFPCSNPHGINSVSIYCFLTIMIASKFKNSPWLAISISSSIITKWCLNIYLLLRECLSSSKLHTVATSNMRICNLCHAWLVLFLFWIALFSIFMLLFSSLFRNKNEKGSVFFLSQ